MTTRSTAAPATSRATGRSITGDPGDDTIYPGDGRDFVYGEEGDNHVIATDDGVYDQIFCALKSGTERGRLTYIGKQDTKDQIGLNSQGVSTCEVEVVNDRPALRALKRSLPADAWDRALGRALL